jgi:uncharacterized protein YqeY
MKEDGESGLRSRLQASLVGAIKARDQVAVSALRSALAAIDNATAVDLPETAPNLGATIAGARSGIGAGDVPRRELSAAEVARIVRGEIAEREATAGEQEGLGQEDFAAQLRAEAHVLEAQLDRPAP